MMGNFFYQVFCFILTIQPWISCYIDVNYCVLKKFSRQPFSLPHLPMIWWNLDKSDAGVQLKVMLYGSGIHIKTFWSFKWCLALSIEDSQDIEVPEDFCAIWMSYAKPIIPSDKYSDSWASTETWAFPWWIPATEPIWSAQKVPLSDAVHNTTPDIILQQNATEIR